MQIIKIYQNDSKEASMCNKSPDLVLAELNKIESNEKGDIIEKDKFNIDEINLNPNDLIESERLIFENSKEVFMRNFNSFFIGGDHSISYPILKAFRHTEADPCLIVFDAHLDVGGVNKGKNKNWISRLIEGGFHPTRIILVSVRNISNEELEYLKKNKVTLIKMDIIQEDLEGICDVLMEQARDSSGFYISIDIDCVDPAFAPGTNEPEVGGLSSRELIYFLKRLKRLRNFKGAEVVEIDPSKDINSITVKLGAKILSELI